MRRKIMKNLIQTPLFWVTVIVALLSVGVALVDLRYKTWLIAAVFAAVVAGPSSAIMTRITFA